MFERAVSILILSLLISALCSSTSSAKPVYVGTVGCNCHKTSVMSWEMSVHARAFESLKPGVKKQEKLKGNMDPDKDYTTDSKCFKCHATGYEREGGFVSLASTPEMAGVGCEACHGPGSEYKVLHDKKKSFTREEAKAAGAVYGSLDPSVCNSCHMNKDTTFTEKIDKKYKFDYKKALENRKSYHKKESTKDSFKVNLF